LNIFVLSKDPKEAAKWHTDKHVVKMPLETAQILCTVRRQYGDRDVPYKATHQSHPCCQWASESLENYVWLCILGIELCVEYTHRYGKTHKCEAIIEDCLKNAPKRIANRGRTPFIQAMPEYCQMDDAVLAYRNYYVKEKSHLASWRNRTIPDWWPECISIEQK
jgi:hypothetical protein